MDTQNYTLLLLWLVSGVLGDRIAFMFKGGIKNTLT